MNLRKRRFWHEFWVRYCWEGWMQDPQQVLMEQLAQFPIHRVIMPGLLTEPYLLTNKSSPMNSVIGCKMDLISLTTGSALSPAILNTAPREFNIGLALPIIKLSLDESELRFVELDLVLYDFLWYVAKILAIRSCTWGPMSINMANIWNLSSPIRIRSSIGIWSWLDNRTTSRRKHSSSIITWISLWYSPNDQLSSFAMRPLVNSN